MTDNELVARLREWDHCWPARWLDTAVPQAADAIERLTRERDEARSRFNDIDLCRMAQAPCNALLDAETRIAELTRERDEARVAALEEAAAAVEQKAKAVCRQECCGYGVGSPPECCGDAILMVSDSEAVDAIRALKEPT